MKKQNFTNKDSALSKSDSGKSDSGVKSATDNISLTLLPYCLCALLCMLLLCGTTWAWFSSSVSGETTPIKAADYKIDVTAETNGAEVSLTDNKLVVMANTEYAVTLNANGTASTGFCIISYKNPNGESGTAVQKKLYTQQISSGSSITFVIKLTYSAEISFDVQWGTSSKADSPDVTDGFYIID